MFSLFSQAAEAQRRQGESSTDHSQPGRTARRSQRGARPAARIGYAAKGVVYAVIGVLAVQAAFGSGGQTTGSKGTLQQIASGSFGQVLLVVIGIGLAGYAPWRLAMATLDPKREGTGAKALVKRTGYAVSGLANGAIAFFAFRPPLRQWRKQFGRWLVGIGGAIVIAVGLVCYAVYCFSYARCRHVEGA